MVVAGGEAHREAKDFMRMLMPSHAKNVVLFQEPEPLFTRYQIERQLNAMFSPYVTLRSGGYLVINQTEALVAIDVNSGKATREFSIEETAYHTNLEAADEIARQLKLRDLAGLIVIDFIDMEEKRNNRSVERRLKEALRFDRARIQVGRISHFGLLEMSRQRLRTGVLEGSTSQCAHCQGTGIIRSTESVALAVLRGLEDAIMAGTRASLIATTTPTVALYILNNKRPFINDMEARVGLPIIVTGSDKLAGANFTIEKGTAPAQPPRRIERTVVNMESGFEGEDEEGGAFEAREPREEVAQDRDRDRDRGEQSDEQGGARRRRRRRRGGRRGERDENGSRFAGEQQGNVEEVPYEDDGHGAHEHEAGEGAQANGEFHDHEHDHEHEHEAGHEAQGDEPGATSQDGDRPRERNGRSRRRGRRGGRRGRDRGERNGEASAQSGTDEQPYIDDLPAYEVHGTQGGEEAPGHAEAISDFPNLPADGNDDLPAKEVHRRHEPRSSAKAARAAAPEQPEAPIAPPAAIEKPEPVAAAPRRRHTQSSEPRLERIVVGEVSADQAPTEDASSSSAPVRKGWWQRKLGG